VTANPRPSATHAARCTACHGVFATPNPAGANIGCAMNVARHSFSPMWLNENPCRSTPTTIRPRPVQPQQGDPALPIITGFSLGVDSAVLR